MPSSFRLIYLWPVLLALLLVILINGHSWLEQDVWRFSWFFTLFFPPLYWLLNRPESYSVELPYFNIPISQPPGVVAIVLAAIAAFIVIQTSFGKLTTQDLRITINNDHTCFMDHTAEDLEVKINGKKRNGHKVERGFVIVPLDQEFIGDQIIVEVEFIKGSCHYMGKQETSIGVLDVFVNPCMSISLTYNCSSALALFHKELQKLERSFERLKELDEAAADALLDTHTKFNDLGRDTISQFYPHCMEDYRQLANRLCQFLLLVEVDVKC